MRSKFCNITLNINIKILEFFQYQYWCQYQYLPPFQHQYQNQYCQNFDIDNLFKILEQLWRRMVIWFCCFSVELSSQPDFRRDTGPSIFHIGLGRALVLRLQSAAIGIESKRGNASNDISRKFFYSKID